MLSLLLLAAIPFVAGQGSQEVMVLDSIHNATTLVGTWSSGSKNVVTGAGFATPSNMSFIYPSTAGISYSFTDTYYEIARYRFTSNASDPSCITGVMNWVHGTYVILSNATIIMTPLGDGYQQIQDPCAAESNFIETYNDTETYLSWRIFTDPTDGYKLHLFQFDNSPLAPQFQVSTSPIMLPTQLLRNDSSTAAVDSDGVTTSRKRSLGDLFRRSNTGEQVKAAGLTILGIAVAIVGLAL